MSKIYFANPDSPEAAQALRALVERVNLPVLGLIVKVNQDDEVVNVELTGADEVKALALASALKDEEEEGA